MREDFEKHIPEIEKAIGYTFSDKSLLTQAFTRTSFCNEQKKSDAVRYSSNEVLEFFGDGVLSLAIITVLLSNNTERYEYGIKTPLGEGDFSNIKSKLSDKKNLSQSMKELGLQKFLLVGEGDEKLGIKNEPSVMEDLFESIIGAIYIDCGMHIPTVVRSVTVMLDTGTYLTKNSELTQSAKNAVQEWCADKRRRLPPPVYKTVSEEGPDHKKVYTRACVINGRVMGTGVGKNCKIADAAAAESALALLREEENKNGGVSEVRSPDAASKLRSLAAKKKLPAPVFTDLGECDGSDGYAKMYEFECSVGNVSARACARSKSEARAMAAKDVINALKGV
ncbi:MAG: hypothetical protein IKB38_06310 [Clostridia bacterium]|nr:hypothetical protein [Clostridia bacterium]